MKKAWPCILAVAMALVVGTVAYADWSANENFKATSNLTGTVTVGGSTSASVTMSAFGSKNGNVARDGENIISIDVNPATAAVTASTGDVTLTDADVAITNSGSGAVATVKVPAGASAGDTIIATITVSNIKVEFNYIDGSNATQSTASTSSEWIIQVDLTVRARSTGTPGGSDSSGDSSGSSSTPDPDPDESSAPEPVYSGGGRARGGSSNGRSATDTGRATFTADSSLVEAVGDYAWRVDLPRLGYVDAYVDGDKLDPDTDCTVREGSTVLALTDRYVQSLGAGDHRLRMEFVSADVYLDFSVAPTGARGGAEQAADAPGIAPVANANQNPGTGRR